MYVIHNDSPQSFSSSEFVEIYDDAKNIFYFHPNDEKEITFNLPAGEYYSKGKIVRRKNFIPYTEFKSFLPANFLSSYVISIQPNENKASIYPNQRKIVVDTNIAKLKYQPSLVFILGHELAHYKYHSPTYSNLIERKCDDESEKYMLANGYNPIQIKLAKKMLLNSNWRANHYKKIRR